jgi:hypothetical protein
MQFIKRSEAVKAIRSGDQFTLEFVTADRKRGTGGELIQVIDWQILNADDDDGDAPAGSGTGGGHSKCPNHDDHETINICNPVNKQVRKIHIPLIQSFNGKRILNG